MPEQTWIEISKDALRHNISILRGLANPNTKLCAVVKANAYGHGLIGTAKAIAPHIDWMAVFTPEDALALRKARVKNPILVLEGVHPEHFKKLAGKNIRVTVCNSAYLKHIPSKLPIHVKIDTGLSRQGMPLAEVRSFFEKIPAHVAVEGIYSHFADAENVKDSTFSKFQINEFNKAVAVAGEAGFTNLIKHLSASDGFLTHPEAEFNMVRTGIAVYGVTPSQGFASKFSMLGFQPALTWKTKVIQLKTITKGATVGYGCTFRAPRTMQVGVLPVGYWDGYPRSLSGKGNVLGRVSMNITVIDGTNLKEGDEVELIGKNISAFELAERAGTISYEIITRINPWIPRKYV